MSSDLPAGRAAPVLLLGSVFAVATCGLVYELVAGAVSSYLLGDAVTQFSLVIGVFLSAMGLGAYLAKFIDDRLIRRFVEIEIWIGVIGGTSSMAMFAMNAFAEPLFRILFYSLCSVLGILVGIEIPLLVRILQAEQGVKGALSHVLAIDYLGALFGAILFPFVALPFLGLSRASAAFGLINLAVAAVGLTLVPPPRRWMATRLVVAFLLLTAAFVGSTRLVGFMEDMLYQDDVVLVRQTAYQRIVVTRWRDDVRLYINGAIQFSSIDEARYHEALVVPAMEAADDARRVLVLGGGDGLAAREILKYPSVERVTIVDLDPEMTELSSSRPELVALNEGSLRSEKVTIVNRDAFQFVRDDRELYDVVLIDLPDPSTPALAKLYSRELYALVGRRLVERGVMATQATSPFYAPEAFWCIVRTIEDAVASDELPPLLAFPYHVNVPSFGEWGFVLASHRSLEPVTLDVSVPTRFLDAAVLRGMFDFGRDLDEVAVKVNRLDDPVLQRYYQQGWNRFSE